MYIKEIRLSGFKSYKDETVVSDLFNGLNIIIGRNGSGKSNIFSAIEFALTLEYSKCLKPQTRDLLVHQGQRKPDVAFVEIVFDNSDRKLPVDDNTVIFRRVMSMKKDKFQVNNKDLANAKQFLDAAGFTNPYFIVKQGKIHELALASDAARLKVISDVTGANAYDTKIAECRRSLEVADEKKKEIQVIMTDLRKRKEALEEEVAQQKRFMKRDQTKRAIEFILHERKVQETEQCIQHLEASRSKSKMRQKPLREDLESIARNIQIHKRDIGEAEIKIKHLQSLKNDHEISKNKITTDLASYKEELQSLNRDIPANHRPAASVMLEEISTYENRVAETESELAKLKEKMDNLFLKKCQLDTRVNQYHEKEVSRFAKSVEESKLREIKQNLGENQQSLESLVTTRQQLEENIKSETTVLQNLRDSFSQLANELNEISRRIEESKMEEQKLKSNLEIVWRQKSENEQILAQKRGRMERLDEDLKRHLGLDVFNGRRGVIRILSDFKSAGTHQDVLNGYYGMVCEIMECDSKLDTAVEVAAGKMLVYHVVQSRKIAEVILMEFNKRKMVGEINFLPINDIKMTNLPHVNDLQGAKLLASLMRFPDKTSRVNDFVFGRTLLCDTLETAIENVRQHHLNCVTLDGSKVSGVGVMSGGYRSRQPQKMELQRAKNIEEKDVLALTDEKVRCDQESNRLGLELERCKQTFEKLGLQKAQTLENKRQAQIEIKTTENKLIALKEQLKSVDQGIVHFKASNSMLEEKQNLLSDNKTDTSGDKMQALKSLRTISSQYSDVEKAFIAKQKEKNVLDAKLKQLRKRYYNFTESSPSEVTNQNIINRLTEEIQSLSSQMLEMQKKIDCINRELNLLDKTVITKQKKVDELIDEQTKLEDQLRIICNELDSFTANHEHWMKKLEDLKIIASKLGTVPTSLENLRNLEEKELCKKLKKLNGQLKDTVKVGVNQKAIQQYEELKEKYKSFETRLTKCLEDENELIELLKDLGERKRDAMLRNIRLIQEQFKQIFNRIVPQGNAELIFHGRNVTIDNSRDFEDIELGESIDETIFEGVEVSVNFVGQRLHNKRNHDKNSLAQLSGGQKSVVALCLILAIQTIDPAPFYIFDEVDQALDAAYRDAVAKLIGEMSERSQFICTTFRKDLIAVADKIYGVSFENRCSHIESITEVQALRFVENQQNSASSSSISPNGSFCHSDSTA